MKRKTILLFIAYILVVFAVYLTSSTLTKYVTNQSSTGEISLGARLFVNYERGQLYRNGNLIVGVEIDEGEIGADNKVADSKRIETMNVEPTDLLVYHFYVSNYDYLTEEDDQGNDVIVKDDAGNPIIGQENGILGQFHVSATAIFSIPARGSSETHECILTYRRVYPNNTFDPWLDFPSDKDIDLPVYANEPVLYEFQVYVVLDEQIESTDHNEYVGSTLSIFIFVDAADKEV